MKPLGFKPESPNDLVLYALAFEPGSPDWRWALKAAKKMAVRRRGRPKEVPSVFDEEHVGLWEMWRINQTTGEKRPYKLAREAVATGQVPIKTELSSVIRRLARLWKKTAKGRAELEEAEELLVAWRAKHR